MKITKIRDLQGAKSVQVSKKVFIVHGRNESIREQTARLVSKLGYEPIILHEQPNSGRTIIEKFEKNSQVVFSIVLLTGDDKGGLIDTDCSKYQARARQNVILELGFFLGSLGRENVCALYESGVEIPSDYQGVVFLPIDDSGAWKLSLAKEMKEAGLNIDLNKVLL